MKGFVIYPTYRIIDDKAYVHIWGWLENGETFLSKSYYRPYFFIKRSDLKKAKKIAECDHEKTGLKNFDREKVEKIILDIPGDVPGLRKKFEEEDIECYEADIRFAYRFMMDKNIRGSLEITGNFEKGKGVDRVYEEPDLSYAEYQPDLKTLALDIETNMNTDEILSVSLACQDYKKVIIISDKKLEKTITVKSEQELLKNFKEEFLKLDPDIVTGWNVVDFDLIHLQEKFKEYNIPFVLGRDNSNCKIRKQESFFRDSSANFPGRMVLDGIQLLKSSFVKLEDYKLDTAAEEFLGEEKIISGKDKGQEIIDTFNNDPQKLVDYNLKDSIMVLDILKETGVLSLTIRRSMLTGMPLDRVKGSIASFDSLYLRELQKKGFVAPSSKYGERGERIKGGHVMTSKPGIYDYVIVCDFKSLYPSIIRTFNIDPFTYVEDCKGEDLVKAPNGACFRKEKGILSEMIEELWHARDEMKKKDDQTGSYAIKVLMNSMFGVMANPVFRFYSIDIGNAITYFGQHLIKLTAKKIEEQGYEVIYGDTDSVFVNLNVDSYEEAKKIGTNIQEKTNSFFQEYITEDYGCKNFLELEFEKTYRRFLMPTARGSKKGSKKRYAGLLKKDGKEEIDFVGLEFVRRDWTDLAKKFQLELLQKIFRKEEVREYIRDFVEKLKEGEYDKLLIYRKAITKDLEDYTKTTPPHVKAARKMKEVNSNIIEYYITINGPEPVTKHKSSIDYDHYIEKQIKPLANTVLSFYDDKFDDILKNSSQMKLSGY